MEFEIEIEVESKWQTRVSCDEDIQDENIQAKFKIDGLKFLWIPTAFARISTQVGTLLTDVIWDQLTSRDRSRPQGLCSLEKL